MGEICIEPEGAKQAGAAISTNSSEAKTRLEARFDEIYPAAQANAGWRTGQALVDFADARKNDILSSLQELDSIGQKIVETVTAKVAVDEHYSDSLSRIGKAVDSMSE
ncbi:hypothetical protein [Nocardia transvalensis]|uniref:hypothetical protein n=1 Tax=Nocardia transvalensis TaxID=37333 RepID=UPI001893D5BB|nr:hypothetical protein [Nocardia transvalensis]MBF6331591.1 hypothetical protein [Nocardia transvalensis]